MPLRTEYFLTTRKSVSVPHKLSCEYSAPTDIFLRSTVRQEGEARIAVEDEYTTVELRAIGVVITTSNNA